MSARFLACALLCLTAAIPASTVSAAPSMLHPTGPWSVEYARDMCVLSRPFGAGQDRLIFAFKPAPNADQSRIMLIGAARSSAPAMGKADIRLSDGSRPQWAMFMSATAKGTSLTSIDVPRSALKPLFEGGTIAIRAGRKLDVVLAPTGMGKAIEALGKCEADLLKTWGMDEAAQAALAKVPEGNLRTIFRPDDYPDDLLDKGVQGSVGFVLRLDAAGAVTSCRVVETSGTAALDETTCTIARQRAKFSPATDRAGRAMPAVTYMRVLWLVEDGFSYELNTTMATPPAAPSRPVN